MSEKTYKIMKDVAQLWIPGLATLYLALGSIWEGVASLPYPEQVSASLMAIDTFLGVVLKISSTNYYKENGQL